jgi:hypothetical protein
LGYAGKDRRVGKKVGYADPDGRETVADWDCRESCPARRLGEQGGERPTGKREANERSGGWKNTSKLAYGGGPGDKGTAARFFPQASWEHEEMECCAGGTFNIPVYHLGQKRVLLSSTQDILVDFLDSLIGQVRNYNKTYNNLLRRVAEYGYSEDNESVESDGLYNDVLHVHHLSEAPGFQCDCLFYLHLYDELLHDVLVSVQGGAPSLADALEYACHQAIEYGHSQQYQRFARPSTSDDLAPASPCEHNQGNSKSVHNFGRNLDEKLGYKQGIFCQDCALSPNSIAGWC